LNFAGYRVTCSLVHALLVILSPKSFQIDPKSFQIDPKRFQKVAIQFKKNYLMYASAYLMPSDLCNSTMAKATGLIFLLLDVASAQEVPFAREVPFAIPLYIQCVLYGLSMALLCVPFIFVHHEVSI